MYCLGEIQLIGEKYFKIFFLMIKIIIYIKYKIVYFYCTLYYANVEVIGIACIL